MPITLDRQEEIDILERIARDEHGGAVARIQALKLLDELRDKETVPDGWAALYAVDSPAARRSRTRPAKPPAA